MGQAAKAATAGGTLMVNAMGKPVWISDGDGGDGSKGSAGSGGGGGGGQKYLFDRNTADPNTANAFLFDHYSWGPSGGGGGGGGCGGSGGSGGQAGGASFGVVLSKSNVDLRGTKVQAGLGGKGGDGGAGVVGGDGGLGASGGATTLVWSNPTVSFVKASPQRIKPVGKGGKGGAGGAGSAGAGGAGGASVAVYCIDNESSYAGGSDVKLTSLGSADGGNSPGGAAGPKGLSSQNKGCF